MKSFHHASVFSGIAGPLVALFLSGGATVDGLIDPTPAPSEAPKYTGPKARIAVVPVRYNSQQVVVVQQGGYGSGNVEGDLTTMLESSLSHSGRFRVLSRTNIDAV